MFYFTSLSNKLKGLMQMQNQSRLNKVFVYMQLFYYLGKINPANIGKACPITQNTPINS